jgi:hypothetical protein
VLKLDLPAFEKLLSETAECYDRKPPTPAAIKLWFELLEKNPWSQVEAGLRNWLRSKPKFPSPSEFMTLLDPNKPSSEHESFPRAGNCEWNGGGNCSYPGAISTSTKGGGPWFCRFHFLLDDPIEGARIAEESKSKANRDRYYESTRPKGERVKRIGFESVPTREPGEEG